MSEFILTKKFYNEIYVLNKKYERYFFRFKNRSDFTDGLYEKNFSGVEGEFIFYI